MGCADNKVFIIYWRIDQPYYIQRAHHYFCDECNDHISTEENNNTISLLLQKDTEIIIHNLDLINLVPC